MMQMSFFGGDTEVEETRKQGGGDSVCVMIGATNHSKTGKRAEHDFYATPPIAVEKLLELENLSHKVLEPCCGTGHISKVLEAAGHEVDSRDLVDRGYGKSGCDFFAASNDYWDGDIVTNPPYNLGLEFVKKALSIIPDGRKVCVFMKLQFAEGQSRREFFRKNPPLRVWVSSSRLECGKNGKFTGASAVCYCWWVWQKGYKGETVMKWFN